MLVTLLDRGRGEPLPLPEGLRRRYDGPLGFPSRADRPYVIANFVSTLDGIVSFAEPGRAKAAVISRGEPADRFVMGLLRASADVVMVGAGTLRVEGPHSWTPAHIFRDAAADYAELRERLGKSGEPATVFVTASGDLDLSAPALSTPNTFVITPERSAARLRTAPRDGARVLVAPGDPPTARALLDVSAAATGARLVLHEGGPTLIARFLAEGLVDELFLTVAPQLAGRARKRPRLALVEGHAFAPEAAPWGQLVSAKTAGDFLFLRYAITGPR